MLYYIVKNAQSQYLSQLTSAAAMAHPHALWIYRDELDFNCLMTIEELARLVAEEHNGVVRKVVITVEEEE